MRGIGGNEKPRKFSGAGYKQVGPVNADKIIPEKERQESFFSHFVVVATPIEHQMNGQIYRNTNGK